MMTPDNSAQMDKMPKWKRGEQINVVHTCQQTEGTQIVTRFKYGQYTYRGTGDAEAPSRRIKVPNPNGTEEVWRCAKGGKGGCHSCKRTAGTYTDLTEATAAAHGITGVLVKDPYTGKVSAIPAANDLVSVQAPTMPALPGMQQYLHEGKMQSLFSKSHLRSSAETGFVRSDRVIDINGGNNSILVPPKSSARTWQGPPTGEVSTSIPSLQQQRRAALEAVGDANRFIGVAPSRKREFHALVNGTAEHTWPGTTPVFAAADVAGQALVSANNGDIAGVQEVVGDGSSAAPQAPASSVRTRSAVQRATFEAELAVLRSWPLVDE